MKLNMITGEPPEKNTAQRWTRRFQGTFAVGDLGVRNGHVCRSLIDDAAVLRGGLFIETPIEVQPTWLSGPCLRELAREAEESLRQHGYVHNAKWNAPVGVYAEEFVDGIDLAAYVEKVANIPVHPPTTATYIGYLDTGQGLELHLDDAEFGDINLLLSLSHVAPEGIPCSSTVFVEGDGLVSYPLRPGQGLVFDGVFIPHGRTPVSGGERVILVNFGFRALSGGGIERYVRAPLPPE